MHLSKSSFPCCTAIGAGVALLLCSGCITVPDKIYTDAGTYELVRSPVQVDASAAVEAVDTLAPEWRAKSKRMMSSDSNLAAYSAAVEQALRNDLVTSGLFARIVTDNPAKADYLVRASCLESYPSDYRVSVTLTATETATGTQISTHTREHSFGTSIFKVKVKEALPGLMASLKADLAADLQAKTRRQQEQAARAEAELLTKASLSDLLTGADGSVALARARNRALIAAKNQQLPAILRDRKTDELSALVVKIEQTILDLNHESEVAKDRAQQATANPEDSSGRDRGQPAAAADRDLTVDELRDLSISYRERIELLKPIAAALKEEIANRNR